MITKWIMSLLLCSALILRGMDGGKPELTFEFAHSVKWNGDKAVAMMFPHLRNSITEGGNYVFLREVLPANLRTWFSFAREIRVKGADNYEFPSFFPLQLKKNAHRFLDTISIYNYAGLLKEGSFLQVPQPVMHLMANFFFKKLLSQDEQNLLGALGQFIDFDVMIIEESKPELVVFFKNFFMRPKEVRKVQRVTKSWHFYSYFSTGDLALEEASVYLSRNGEYIGYFGQSTQTQKYPVYTIDIKSEQPVLMELQHEINPNARNRTKRFMKFAAQEPFFMTIAPDDDRVLVYNAKNKSANHVINLNLEEKERIGCCDISADGKYVIIGIENIGTDRPTNKFVIYDQYSNLIHSFSMPNHYSEKFELPPRISFCHPTDSSTMICSNGNRNWQSYATLNDNAISMPFAQNENFLNGNRMQQLFYCGSGKYIFALCDNGDDSTKTIYRLDSEHLLDRAPQKHTVLFDYRYLDQLITNEDGDIAAYQYQTDENGSSIKKVHIINYFINQEYDLEGNIESVALDGYILTYIEKIAAGIFNMVLYDTCLKQKLFIQKEQIPYNYSILGINKKHQLLLRVSAVEPPFTGIRNLVGLYDILTDCGKEIIRNIQNTTFVASDAAWLENLIKFYIAIRGHGVKQSLSNLTVEHEVIFSDSFLRILKKCGIIPGESYKKLMEAGIKKAVAQLKPYLFKKKHAEIAMPQSELPAASQAPVIPQVRQPQENMQQQPTLQAQQAVQPIVQQQSQSPSLLNRIIAGVTAIFDFFTWPFKKLFGWA